MQRIMTSHRLLGLVVDNAFLAKMLSLLTTLLSLVLKQFIEQQLTDPDGSSTASRNTTALA